MHKKTLTIIILLAVVLLAAFLYYRYPHNPNPQSTPIHISNTMGGQIVGLKSRSVTIDGIARPLNKISGHFEKKKIEFTITPGTVFKKTVYKIPAGTKPGVPFKPEEKTGPGDISDLAVGIRVLEVQSTENLFTVDKATVVIMNYAIYDFDPLKK